MRYTVYKPNPKVTGSLATFAIGDTKNKKEEWEKTLFIEFIPQKSWNAEKHSGQFDYENKKIVAINIGEAGEIIHSLKSGTPFQNFHKSAKGTSVVKVGFWDKDRSVGQEGQKGFWRGKIRAAAIGVSYNGQSVNVPLEPGEQEVIVHLLEGYIKQAITQDSSNEKKRRKAFEAKKEGKVDAPKDDVFDDTGNAIDDSDVPF